jgi:hypothetical protein
MQHQKTNSEKALDYYVRARISMMNDDEKSFKSIERLTRVKLNVVPRDLNVTYEKQLSIAMKLSLEHVRPARLHQ